MDDIRRAYAVLGLEQGSPMRKVRTRYRALVRTWHPDRYAGDPQGQAEASVRMRAINSAYSTLLRHLKNRTAPPHASAPRAGRRLSQEEIDRMVGAIGSEGLIDAILGVLGWVGRTLDGFVFILFMVGLLVQAVVALWTGGLRALLSNWEFVAVVAILAILWLREYWHRRHLGDAVGTEVGGESALSTSKASKP